MGLLEKLEEMVRKRGWIYRCELTEVFVNNFRFYDENNPTISGSIEKVCREFGFDINDDKLALKIVNTLRGEDINWEDAWLFVEPEMLDDVVDVINSLPLTRCDVMEYDVKVGDKEYKVVRTKSKLDVEDGDFRRLDNVVKVGKRVLADDGIITGFIVEAVFDPIKAVDTIDINWRREHLFVEPDMLDEVIEILNKIPSTKTELYKGRYRSSKYRHARVNGKNYAVVVVRSWLDKKEGDFGKLEKAIKVKKPRVLSDDGMIMGFIVKAVFDVS
ncbi:hypothetical protein AFULGI_00006130 [Archaeoglobus fulgidus DSM 8774]|uniref:Uncharacterized protein n=1 Tax=Archaeoglobus fulgidus DSM 8774 TaxID=1344584 RepID=A0A075WE46_ARCFL|nr:hypothetical protein [Archaeoglobus fulgidus]AIG97414.1 hypothetical protein AFULGI_00006130 [Archaeoglobus fulgidus DSM 8774]